MNSVYGRAESLPLPSTKTTKLAPPVAGVGFTWLMALIGLYTSAGAYLDGWAHSTGKTDTSFFTPWHAVLYSGLLLGGLILGTTIFRNLSQGYSMRFALPSAYRVSLLGVGVFAIGGMGDLVWHTLLGIEKGFEALYSPSHIVLGIGISLLALGPLNDAWQRSNLTMRTLGEQLPMILSLTALYSVLTFFTQDIHWIYGFAGNAHRPSSSNFYTTQMVGFSAVLLQTAIMLGVVLLAIRRWRLAPGALTFMLYLNAVGMVFQDDDYRFDLLLAAVVAAVIIDIIYGVLRPSADRPGAFRLFAVAMPAVFFLIHFGVLLATQGLWWSVHLWTGAVSLAAITGWLMSYAFLPPAIPSDQAMPDGTTRHTLL